MLKRKQIWWGAGTPRAKKKRAQDVCTLSSTMMLKVWLIRAVWIEKLTYGPVRGCGKVLLLDVIRLCVPIFNLKLGEYAWESLKRLEEDSTKAKFKLTDKTINLMSCMFWTQHYYFRILFFLFLLLYSVSNDKADCNMPVKSHSVERFQRFFDLIIKPCTFSFGTMFP